MSRLADAFSRGALVAYVMGGDPDPAKSLEYCRAALRGGAGVLEIGVPFSDPVADGPTIQRAGVRALNAKTRMDDVLGLARTLSAETDVPLVLMTYYNPVLQRGLDKFAADAAAAGVAGIILPDVPLEESEDAARALAAAGIDLVQLATPATPPERVARLAEASRGFLYLVSTYGVTGARGDLSPHAVDLVKRAKGSVAARVPLAVGFGVSTPAHVHALRQAGADGVIVGSAIVRLIEEGAPPAKVEAFVRELAGAV